jgi:hypothetical protein
MIHTFSLHKNCEYREDSIQPSLIYGNTKIQQQKWATDGATRLDQELLLRAVQILGPIDNIKVMLLDFFITTHKKLAVISKSRFLDRLPFMASHPRADFWLLCLCIHLTHQLASMQSKPMLMALYSEVQRLVNELEQSQNPTLALVQCRLFLTFFELGHGLHSPAYISIAICAKTARLIGLHRKQWRTPGLESDLIGMEEDKRTWWSIVNLDRYINLLNGDAMFVTDDSESSDPLPIEDQLWLEDAVPTYIESAFRNAPVLATSSDVVVVSPPTCKMKVYKRIGLDARPLYEGLISKPIFAVW